MKRVVTSREFDAFTKANRTLMAATSGLAQAAMMAETVRDGALAQGDIDSALNAVAMGTAIVVDGLGTLPKDYERAAYNFLGESLKPGEAFDEFVSRISEITKGKGDDEDAALRAILAVQKHNGITWNLTA